MTNTEGKIAEKFVFQSKVNKTLLVLGMIMIGIVILFFYQMLPTLTLAQKSSGLIISWVLAVVFLLAGFGGVYLIFHALAIIKVTEKHIKICYPVARNKVIPLNQIKEIVPIETNQYGANYIFIKHQQRTTIKEVYFVISGGSNLWKAINIISEYAGVEITLPPSNETAESNIDKYEERGIIKSYLNLIGALAAFLFWLVFLFTKSDHAIQQSDLVPIKAKIQTSPVLNDVPDNDRIEFSIEGYTKTFILVSNILEASCADAFLEDAIKGSVVTVFVQKEDRDELNEEYEINNTIAIYQVELEGKSYVSMDLYNALREADRTFRDYSLLSFALILLLYAFISKPKVSVWIVLIVALVVALFFMFEEEGQARKKYDPCVEVVAGA